MLPGVNDKRQEGVGTLFHRGHDWRHLHEVGPRTDDVNNFQHFFSHKKHKKDHKSHKQNLNKVSAELSMSLCAFCGPFCAFCDHNLMIRALLSRRTSPFSALRVSTMSGTREQTRL